MEDQEPSSEEQDDVSPAEQPEAPAEPNLELKKLLNFKTYRRRWFVLSVLCCLNFSNGGLWLTFAPVADQSAQYLSASLQQINWLSIVFMVVAIPLTFGTTWMLDTLGLRITLILGSWLNMMGAVIRFVGCIDRLDETSRYPVVMFGQILAALAQPLIIFAPTKLAALWFPDHQRAKANTMASMANPLGILFANVLSPGVVTANQIPQLLLFHTLLSCIFCFLATVGIRSSIPPTPPSASAEFSNSEPFTHGFKLLLKNKPFLILMVCFGSGIGVFTSFSSLLQQFLCVQGYPHDFPATCGVTFIFAGLVGAAILGAIVDETKKLTEATKINMCLAALACIVFSVVAQMRQQNLAVAIACALLGFFGFSIYPVAMELGVECSYPVGEATSAGLLFVSGQVQSALYTILFQALTKRITDSPLSSCKNVILSWRVPLMVMAGLFSFMTCSFVIFFQTKYKRLEAEVEAEAEANPVNSQNYGSSEYIHPVDT